MHAASPRLHAVSASASTGQKAPAGRRGPHDATRRAHGREQVGIALDAREQRRCALAGPVVAPGRPSSGPAVTPLALRAAIETATPPLVRSQTPATPRCWPIWYAPTATTTVPSPVTRTSPKESSSWPSRTRAPSVAASASSMRSVRLPRVLPRGTGAFGTDLRHRCPLRLGHRPGTRARPGAVAIESPRPASGGHSGSGGGFEAIEGALLAEQLEALVLFAQAHGLITRSTR